MSNQTDFNTAYRASLAPKLQNFPFSENEAALLALEGYLVDVPIMVDNWDPWTTMKAREAFGMTWVPSALQKPLGAVDGYTLPGVPPLQGTAQIAYPSVAPAGTIHISSNVSDYPPFSTPKPRPTPVPSDIDPVGSQSFGSIYLTISGFQPTDGQQFTDARGTFTAHVKATPFGFSSYWELTVPATPQPAPTETPLQLAFGGEAAEEVKKN